MQAFLSYYCIITKHIFHGSKMLFFLANSQLINYELQ